MKILFRTDASQRTGAGHAMRCLALAQAFQDASVQTVFAMAETLPAVAARLDAESIPLVSLPTAVAMPADAASTAELAHQMGCQWVVVDGYIFDADYQSALKAEGLRVLFIDDNGHASHYEADYVLNQNIHATPALYHSRSARTALLLGPQYALMRREFNAWRGWKREIPPIARKILVTLGGSDPDNATLFVIGALNALKARGPADTQDFELRILVTSAHPCLPLLEEECQKSGFGLLVNVSNVPEQMAAADLAISAAGSTGYEMSQLGLPACLLVTAENQAGSAEELCRRDIFLNLGRVRDLAVETLTDTVASLLTDAPRRRSMMEKGQALVDGRGAERLANLIATNQLNT